MASRFLEESAGTWAKPIRPPVGDTYAPPRTTTSGGSITRENKYAQSRARKQEDASNLTFGKLFGGLIDRSPFLKGVTALFGGDDASVNPVDHMDKRRFNLFEAIDQSPDWLTPKSWEDNTAELGVNRLTTKAGAVNRRTFGSAGEFSDKAEGYMRSAGSRFTDFFGWVRDQVNPGSPASRTDRQVDALLKQGWTEEMAEGLADDPLAREAFRAMGHKVDEAAPSPYVAPGIVRAATLAVEGVPRAIGAAHSAASDVGKSGIARVQEFIQREAGRSAEVLLAGSKAIRKGQQYSEEHGGGPSEDPGLAGQAMRFAYSATHSEATATIGAPIAAQFTPPGLVASAYFSVLTDLADLGQRQLYAEKLDWDHENAAKGKATTIARDFAEIGMNESPEDAVFREAVLSSWYDPLYVVGKVGTAMKALRKAPQVEKLILSSGPKFARAARSEAYLGYIEKGSAKLTEEVYGMKAAYEAVGVKGIPTRSQAADLALLEESVVTNARLVERDLGKMPDRTGYHLIESLKSKLRSPVAAFSDADHVRDQLNFLKSQERVETVVDSLNIPLTASKTADRTGLGINGRALKPEAARTRAKGLIERIITNGIDPALRGTDITPKWKTELTRARGALKALTPTAVRRLEMLEADLLGRGYTLNLVDKVTNPEAFLSVRTMRLDAPALQAVRELEGVSGSVRRLEDMATARDGLLDVLNRKAWTELAGGQRPYENLDGFLDELDNFSASNKTLFDYVQKNADSPYVKDILNTHFNGKMPSADDFALYSAQIQKNTERIRNGLVRAKRRGEKVLQLFGEEQVHMLQDGIQTLQRHMDKYAPITETARALVEDARKAISKSRPALPRSFTQALEHPQGLAAAWERVAAQTADIFKPLTNTELRRVTDKKLADGLRKLGIKNPHEIEALISHTQSARFSGEATVLSSSGATGLVEKIVRKTGVKLSNAKFESELLTKFDDVFRRIPIENHKGVLDLLEKTYGATIASGYHRLYNMVRFGNIRFALAEIMEAQTANTFRSGATNYYRALPRNLKESVRRGIPEAMEKFLARNLGDVRQSAASNQFGQTLDELRAAAYDLSKKGGAQAEVAKGLLGRLKDNAPNLVGSVRARAIDNVLVNVAKDETMKVLSSLPEYQKMIEKAGSPDQFWQQYGLWFDDLEKANLQTKTIFLDELGMSTQRARIIKSEILDNIRARVKAQGAVPSMNVVTRMLNHPFASPFFGYNYRIGKIAARAALGRAFNRRQGLGLLYLGTHWEELTHSEAAMKQWAKDHPDTAKLAQYVLFFANPFDMGFQRSVLAGLDNAANGDPWPLIEGLFIAPIVPQFTSAGQVIGASKEARRASRGQEAATGRNLPGPLDAPQ